MSYQQALPPAEGDECLCPVGQTGSALRLVRNLFGTRDRLRGRQFFHDGGWVGRGGDGSGSNASDGERWEAAGEALLARPLLSVCCVARFLTGWGLVPLCGPEAGDPCTKASAALSHSQELPDAPESQLHMQSSSLKK